MSEPNRMSTARNTSPPSTGAATLRSPSLGLWSYYKAVLGLGVLLLLLAIPAAQTAQAGGGGSLIGIASDASETRVGVEGLIVSLVGADGQISISATDAHGRFEFLDLDPGNYTLIAQGEGYQDARKTSVHIRKGRSATIRMLIPKGSTVRVLNQVDESFARVAPPQPLVDLP